MKTAVRFAALFVFVLFSYQLFAKPIDVYSVRKVADTMMKAEAKLYVVSLNETVKRPILVDGFGSRFRLPLS